MEDKSNMTPLQLRLPDALLERLDHYRSGMQIKPTRAQAMRYLLENALNSVEASVPAVRR